MGSPYMGTITWLFDEGCEELLDAPELLLAAVPELLESEPLLRTLELLLCAPEDELA